MNSSSGPGKQRASGNQYHDKWQCGLSLACEHLFHICSDCSPHKCPFAKHYCRLARKSQIWESKLDSHFHLYLPFCNKLYRVFICLHGNVPILSIQCKELTNVDSHHLGEGKNPPSSSEPVPIVLTNPSSNLWPLDFSVTISYPS